MLLLLLLLLLLLSSSLSVSVSLLKVMWTVKIKTLNEDVIVAVLTAISTIANKPGFIWKKSCVPMGGSL